ncbi:MAG: class I SAM-dependent methyltransferase [Caldilineales bacterium]
MSQPAASSQARAVYQSRIYENHGLAALTTLVQPEDHAVLDIGCGAGANMAALRARGHAVTGITVSQAEADRLHQQGFAALMHDVTSDALPFPAASFDALLFSHVLEHLPWPDEVLTRYKTLLRPDGRVYIAIPNALHLVQRWQFLRGRFRYTEQGLMDCTHLRFFDFHSARAMVESAGLTVQTHLAPGQIPLGPLRTLMPAPAARLDAWVSQKRPALFGSHILMVAKHSPYPPAGNKHWISR